jgi:hypothetical protein
MWHCWRWALLLRKNSLGNAYNNYFKGVRYINSIEKFSKIFEETEGFKMNDDCLYEGLAFLMYCTHFGAINFFIDNNSRVVSKENLYFFAKSVIQELKIEANFAG